MTVSEIRKKLKFHTRVPREKCRAAAVWLDRRPVTFIAILALFMTLVIETVARRSMAAGLLFMFTNPLLFLGNALILFAFYSLSLFLKRRYSLILVFTGIWLGLGVANYITTAYRITPISLNDILLLGSVFSIIGIYLTLLQMVLIVASIAAALTAVVISFLKQKKRPVAYLKTGIVSAVSAIVVAASLFTAINSTRVIKDFAFIGTGYKKYGFVFSFCLSAVDRGIRKPASYGEIVMESVAERVRETKTNKVTPDTNIVFVQLESFFDVNRLKDVVYNENPLPNFTYLKENFPHGYLTVPSLGAGTANTEFEIITQMNRHFFGIAETPYKTVMQDKTCETINYDLRELGYACHAVHNHQGRFYDRNVVFADMGFDTFTSLEYMQNTESNPIGWAKDYVLTEEIIKCLDSTKGLDFIFAISVQGHGKYPDIPVAENQEIKVVSGMEDSLVPFEYFVNQLREMDDFVHRLTAALSQYGEKVVVVFYGDHFPSFEISEDDLTEGDMFQTDYVVWSNFGLETKAENLKAYQLSSEIMRALGINNGFLTKYHQTSKKREDYLPVLEMIQYDTLYGENYIYAGKAPYIPTDLRMGAENIRISRIELIGDGAFITGNGFTRYSHIAVNGEYVDTTFINGNTLFFHADALTPDYRVSVAQVAADSTVLSETEVYKGSLE